jgi:competence protein ComEC
MQSRFRRALLLTSLLLLGATVIAIHEWQRWPDGRLHVTFLDIGQGDSAFVVTPSGKQILIDGGRDDALLRELGKRMPLFDRTIDLLVMSHPQLDHMFAFPDVIRRYRVRRVLMTGVPYALPRYYEFLRLVREKKIPVWMADPRHDIRLEDGVTLDILWPPPIAAGQGPGDVNNSSIVLRVEYGTGSALFTGDMEEEEEHALLASGQDVSATILKVGHHGSKTSSGTGFLMAVGPRVAVISCGRGNSYGHPHPMILKRFETLGIPVRVTAEEGSVHLSW